MKIILRLLTILLSIALPGAVFADAYDIPQNMSAELNGMANAGMAFVKGGTAIPMNPAGLAAVKQFDAAMTVNVLLMTYTAPADGPYSELHTDNYVPLGLVAAGYRINEMITVGFSFFTPSGGGASFKNTRMGDPSLEPRDFNGNLVFFEFGPAVAINLLNNLRIGVGYRINYIKQWGKLYADPVSKAYSDASLSGWSYTGFRFGIQYDVLSWVHLGASYRTPIELVTNGNTTLTFPAGNSISGKTKSWQRYTDMFATGISFNLLGNALTLNIDGSITFYDRYKTSKHEFDINGVVIKNETPVHNKRGYSASIGLEYFLTPSLPLRLGFSPSTNIFDEQYMTPQLGGVPAPSYVYAIGGGYYFANGFRINLALSYLVNEGSVRDFSGYNVPGKYSANGPYVSIEGKYLY